MRVLEALDVVEHERRLPADPVDFDGQTGWNGVEGQIHFVWGDCDRRGVGKARRVRHRQNDLVARKALEVMPARRNLERSGLGIREWSAGGVYVRVVAKQDRPRECARRQCAVFRIARVPRVGDQLARLKEMSVRGVRIVAVGGLPTRIVTSSETVEVAPSDTVSRAVYCPAV